MNKPLTPDESESLRRIVADLKGRPGPLLEVLHAIQAALGHVPPAAVPVVADGLNLSRAEVHGVVTFYHYFRHTAPGKHTVSLRRAEACQSMGANALAEHARSANQGHACVKGRFAFGYATHPDRITRPLIRARITEEWREVSWEEAINHAASEIRRIQGKYGRNSVGGITTSRCTNEETFLVQKLVRAAFGTNNVDTCARVCHSPTGYGLKNTMPTLSRRKTPTGRRTAPNTRSLPSRSCS